MTINAKESKQIGKIRKKLEKMINEEQSRFNKETLDEMRISIHKWLDRHEPERESSQERTFTLFDENRHSSEVKSKFVLGLLEELKKEQAADSTKRSSLVGRVTHAATTDEHSPASE